MSEKHPSKLVRKTVNIKDDEEHDKALAEIKRKGGRIISRSNFSVGSSLVYEYEE